MALFRGFKHNYTASLVKLEQEEVKIDLKFIDFRKSNTIQS